MDFIDKIDGTSGLNSDLYQYTYTKGLKIEEEWKIVQIFKKISNFEQFGDNVRQQSQKIHSQNMILDHVIRRAEIMKLRAMIDDEIQDVTPIIMGDTVVEQISYKDDDGLSYKKKLRDELMNEIYMTF